ncbi:transglycosylase SLT domain-containing protein [Actinomycetospora callitridis]|uniref:transglycosylase SLT domain-containing protein n=1 Tax=Actinomycetospora callitridis TaxID=913944 RepID=UPI002365A024|nr:transglycosylase SLT domain-containing protein [Actinomycetospora callitridis]MDD7919845.1 transglycosylase SLT domain-containing protein [Actinomycetospora callitridis]
MSGDLEAALAGEPAAAELAAIAGRVRTVDPGALRASAAQIVAVGDAVDGSMRAVGRGAAAVEGRWRGTGATAFGDWARAFAAAGARDRSALVEAGPVLDQVGVVLEDLRREIDQQVARAVALAGSARAQAATVPDAPPDLADRLAGDAVRGPTEAARTAVRRAEAELTASAARIRDLADGLTSFAALEGLDAPPSGATPTVVRSAVGQAPAGRVGDWIREALAILTAAGIPPEKMDPAAIATIIQRESGGDPDAVNTWDANAERGTPSQGLMQTIGPTFEAYKLPGHDEITDPVDNIIAGVRYAVDRYGSVSAVPGVEALARGDSYVGY